MKYALMRDPNNQLTPGNACLFAKNVQSSFFNLPDLIPLKFRIASKYLFGMIIFISLSSSLVGQQKINGIVLGLDSLPLPGVSIFVKGSGKGTISGADGSFSILAGRGDILIFSSVGYKEKQIRINQDSTISVVLNKFISNLDQIVVTGYTSENVKNIAGSVVVVNPKQLIEVPAGQVEQMLQGRVAGLTVISTGEPGSASVVRLHGIGNFGDVTPLYIIDGIQGDINAINPNDIESLQVLKDAGAYSIYGVRGANGVIVITTKKGRQGKTKINYDFYIGVQEPLRKGLDMLSPLERANLLWIAKKNSGDTSANGNPSYDQLYGNGSKPILPDYSWAGPNHDTLYEGNPLVNPNLYNLDVNAGDIYQIVRFSQTGTDWFHYMYQPAISQNHTVSASGGSDNNHYLFSLGYLDQQGTMINTFLKRFTARINTEFVWKNIFHFGENVQLAYISNPQSDKFDPTGVNHGSDPNAAVLFDPAVPVYDIKGGWNTNAGFGAGPMDNPVGRRTLAKDNKTNRWQVFGNAYAQLDFLKSFNLRSNFGGNITNYYYYNFSYPSYDYIPGGSTGYPSIFEETSGYQRSWTWTNTINYSQKIARDHSISAIIGIEQISNYNREQGGKRTNFFFNDPNYRFLSNGSPTGQSNYSFAGSSAFFSFIGKLDYNFRDKYILSATIRRDGSSIFSFENRFGWFPAIALAWRVSEEKFLRGSDWLTEFKLRGSWGQTGYYGNTDPLNQYTLYNGNAGNAFYDIFGVSAGSIQPGLRTIRIGNPSTGWEHDVVTNIGFESVLWNGKLNITADLYNKQSKGLLFQVALPDILGNATRPNVNVGDISNKGIDLLVGSRGKLSRNISWDLTLTFTSYSNQIKKLNQLPFFDDFYGLVRNEVGFPISSYFGYKILGFFNDSASIRKYAKQDGAAIGRFRYADVDGSGKITDSDRIHIGNPNPKFTLGINIGFTCKNFDLSTFCYWSYGNDVLNLVRERADIFSMGGYTKTALYDSWTPMHKNAKAPISELSSTFSSGDAKTSYPIEKGSYFRNKSIILGFNFPKNWLHKFSIERIRIYIQVTNLFTITNYTGLDPELPGTGLPAGSKFASNSTFGIDTGNYPNNQRQYLLGLNVSL